jgi:hypothetical protein
MRLLSITPIFCKQSYELFWRYQENDRILIAESGNDKITTLIYQKLGMRKEVSGYLFSNSYFLK